MPTVVGGAPEFYKHHGFKLVSAEETPALLRRYWSISDRQLETSAVLKGSRQQSGAVKPRKPVVVQRTEIAL